MADHSFPDDLERLFRADAAGVDTHPETGTLLAYARGELAAAVREEVASHLSLCSECTSTVLDLGRFPAVELRMPGHTRSWADQEADWQAIEKAWAQETAAEVSPSAAESCPAVTPEIARRVWKPSSPWAQIAALFLLTTLGLLAVQIRGPKPLAARANVQTVDLFPLGSAGTRSGNGASVLLSPSTGTLILFLVRESLAPEGLYSVHLTVGSDGKAWIIDGLVQGEDGSFSLGLARDSLRPGTLQVDLYAANATRGSPLVSYAVDIRIE